MKITHIHFPRRFPLANSIAGIFLALAWTITCLSAAEPGTVTTLMNKSLVGFPGKEAAMITVAYAPGAEDPIHRHNASAFVYVLEGSIIMQVKGEKAVTLHPGDTFYEDPRGIHSIGRNASKTKPAKFLVFLVKDQNSPIFVPLAK